MTVKPCGWVLLAPQIGNSRCDAYENEIWYRGTHNPRWLCSPLVRPIRPILPPAHSSIHCEGPFVGLVS